MTVYETDLPGVGRKFDLELGDGTLASVVIHHDGRCELYKRAHRQADGEKLLDLTSDEANKLGSLLEGAYFESVDVNELSVPLGDAVIEWVEVPADSPIAGTTIGESEIKGRTDATVIAIQRGTDTTPNPGSDVELAGGDVLVALGTREDHAALKNLVGGDA